MKNTFKLALVILCASTMALGFTSCGNNSSSEKQEGSNSEPKQEESSTITNNEMSVPSDEEMLKEAYDIGYEDGFQSGCSQTFREYKENIMNTDASRFYLRKKRDLESIDKGYLLDQLEGAFKRGFSAGYEDGWARVH